ncbi:hypothetical protein V7S43_008957 [Phytophthora oleae]|uniref:Uncharacterized protein n=1 Tax=Phytophthora oleae TaxID=2107226 RepID=A0ABD3FMC5_9STRA
MKLPTRNARRWPLTDHHQRCSTSTVSFTTMRSAYSRGDATMDKFTVIWQDCPDVVDAFDRDNHLRLTSRQPRKREHVGAPHVQKLDIASVFDDSASNDTVISDNELVESVYSPSDHEPDDEEADAAVTAQGNEVLADNNDDFNVVEPSDTSHQDGAIESNAEAEMDDFDTGEYACEDDMNGHCVPDDDADDPDETEVKIAAEGLFAEILWIVLVEKMKSSVGT